MSDIEIMDLEFLTPARITLTLDGVKETKMVSVDIVNRKVYDDKGGIGLSGYVFDYLDSVNTLPDDFFAAPPEVTAKATEMMECTNDSYLNKISQSESGDNDE